MLITLALANATGSGVTWFVGDSIAQLFESEVERKSSRQRLRRALKMAIVGAISGAEMTLEFHALASVVPLIGLAGLPAALAMSAGDVFVCSSIRNAIMLFLVGWGENFRCSQGWTNVKDKFPLAMSITTILGFPLDVINFYTIPGSAQVAFTRIMDLIAIPPLSWFANHQVQGSRAKRPVSVCVACLNTPSTPRGSRSSANSFAVTTTDLNAYHRVFASKPYSSGVAAQIGTPIRHTCGSHSMPPRIGRWPVPRRSRITLRRKRAGRPPFVMVPRLPSSAVSDASSCTRSRASRSRVGISDDDDTMSDVSESDRPDSSIPSLSSRSARRTQRAKISNSIFSRVLAKMTEWAVCMHAAPSDDTMEDGDDTLDGQGS